MHLHLFLQQRDLFACPAASPPPFPWLPSLYICTLIASTLLSTLIPHLPAANCEGSIHGFVRAKVFWVRLYGLRIFFRAGLQEHIDGNSRFFAGISDG